MLRSVIVAAETASPSMTPLLWAALAAGVILLIWNTIEVGRNDAANVVSAVFGGRILSRRWTLRVAVLGAVIGAGFAAREAEPARAQVFDVRRFTPEQAATIYLSAYMVGAMLLYACSAFGLPVSTTTTMVCALLGAALALETTGVVRWPSVLNVPASMMVCALVTAVAAFIAQRLVRAVIGESWADPAVMRRHGAWMGGGMLALVSYFLLISGVADLSIGSESLPSGFEDLGALLAVLGLWVAFALVIQIAAILDARRVARHLFPCVAVIGTACMAFAFGRNDLANGAGPGVRILSLVELSREGGTMLDFRPDPLPRIALFGCGILLAVGMMTEHAQRVTRAQVRMAGQGDHVKLYAPRWCIRLARNLASLLPDRPEAAPLRNRTADGRTLHFDPLRACVILAASASVIAAADALALPASTTYVAFSAVLATGLADHAFSRGEAPLKLGRAVFCVATWFVAAVAACLAAAGLCRAIHHLGVAGIAAGLFGCLTLRGWVKARADRQEERVRQEAADRSNPDDFALEYEG